MAWISGPTLPASHTTPVAEALAKGEVDPTTTATAAGAAEVATATVVVARPFSRPMEENPPGKKLPPVRSQS